jgi:hypothetical protein
MVLIDSDHTGEDEPLTASLFVRSLSPEGARAEQDRVVSRLRGLRDRDVLADVSLSVWGSRLHPASARRTQAGREIFDTIRQFETWADSQDPPRSLCFGSRTVRSPITGDPEAELVLPVMSLAIAGQERLRCVAPWREGSEVHTVTDCLDALRDSTVVDAHPATRDVDRSVVQ